jgi:hypothetical protein
VQRQKAISYQYQSITLRGLGGATLAGLLLAPWGTRGVEPQTDPAPSSGETRTGFTTIRHVDELRRAMASDHQQIRMAPGVYRITNAAPDNRTVFHVTGSSNQFDLRGVTLQVDTAVLASLRGPVHSLATYRVSGSRITFEGATFENTGDQPPFQGLSEFEVSGDDVTFRNCRFILRGSAPYGYGDLYGKGAGAAVRLQKHSALGITGDRALIQDCDFRIHTFGHGIHLHGAQDTVIRGVTMEGALRRSDELYLETEGLAARFEHRRMYPPWLKGEPIPRHQMLSLTEDGIRAYLDGPDRNGQRRRTGHVTVENCRIQRMRGGITLCMAASGTITGCTVLDSGGHAYSVPSKGVVRNSRGNAAYSPLLVMPYKQTRHADIDLEWLPAEDALGDHPLALITGDAGHRIRIACRDVPAPEILRPIIIGSAGERYTEANTDPEALNHHHLARSIHLENLTPHPVRLTRHASDCRVLSRGNVEDQGERNIR